MGKAVKLFIGALLCLIGLVVLVVWWSDVLILLRGGIGFGIILIGLLFLAVASD